MTPLVTDISVVDTGAYFAEDRSWLHAAHGSDMPINVPLDYTLFTGANFEDGFIKSGCLLGRVTATGKFGPYDSGASDGTEVAVAALFNTSKIPAKLTTVASDAGLVHFHCKQARLPYESGLGAVDADAQAAMTLVYWN